jgi:hypothetical protein
MRFVLGGLALIAAVVIVGCSATTLFLTAFHSVSVPWQQWVAGVTIATIVAWEAVALLVIGYCFRKWYIILGVGTSLALVLAMAVTASLEWKGWIGGRADVSTERSVKANDRDRVLEELGRAYKRRDSLQEMERLTKFQQQELTEVKARIVKLEGQWDTRTVDIRASGNVDGEAIHDLLGWDARTTQIVIDTLPMWLMMLLRVISVPGAVVAISAMRSEKAAVAPGRPEALPATDAAPRAFTPALPLSPRAELRPYSGPMAKLAGVAKVNSSENPISSPEVFPDARENPTDDGPGTPAPAPEEPKIEEVAAVRSDKVISLFRDDGSLPDSPRGNKKAQKPEAKAAAWLAACTSQTGNPKHTVTSGECWKSYLAYCETEGKRPMHRKPFSSQVGVLVGRKTGKARKRDKNGSVFTGLMINPVMAIARRRVA